MAWIAKIKAVGDSVPPDLWLVVGSLGAVASGVASLFYLFNSADIGVYYCDTSSPLEPVCTSIIGEMKVSEVAFLIGLAVLVSAFLLGHQKKRLAVMTIVVFFCALVFLFLPLLF